jgi:biotin carboxyl carrier protein
VAKKPAVPVQADDRAAAIESLIKGINSKARGAVVVRGAEAVTSPWMYLRRPVGIPSLDIALNGGVPAGGISRWWGEKSSGKDMLFWNAVRQQQDIMGDNAAVAMADTDTGIDKTQARMLGVILPYSETEIRKLEEEIASMDSSASSEVKVKQVLITEVQSSEFRHYVSVQGMLEAEENLMVTAKMPGMVKEVRVKEGDVVSKGQVLAVLDDEVLKKSIDEVKAGLNQVTELYEKQKSLWEIGRASCRERVCYSV